MAGYSNYQVNEAKHSSKINLFKIKRNRKNETSHSDHFKNKMKIWVGFYRSNPHRFAKDFLNVDLKLFQAILLWAMMHHNRFMLVASRGAGKSFLSAIFLVIRCILYPGTKVIIASGVKSQSINVLLKIQDELVPRSQLLAREIAEINTGTQNAFIRFHGGSIIRVVAATDSSRSARANLILVDEFRMVKKEIVDTVLRKFLTSPRTPGFLEKPEYKSPEMREKYKESNKEMYLSSAYYKFHWSYDLMNSYISKMANGAKYFVSHLPYQLGLYEGIYDKQFLFDEMTQDDFNEISWMMEMEAKWYGESEKAYFKFQDLEVNRKEIDAFHPQEVTDLVDPSLAPPKKKKSEIRLLGVDIAVSGGAENDASVFSVLSLNPSGKSYERTLTYMEDMEGAHSEMQAIRIQQLREDFDIDYVVFDVKGVGIGVLDALMIPTFDEERGEKYEPLTVVEDADDKYADRCRYEDAKKCIVPIAATQELNMEIAGRMADALKKNRLKLLVKQQNAVEKFQKNRKFKYLDLDPSIKARLLLPYVQTELLTQEMLNLETVRNDNGTFKLIEQGKMRKDRYTSVSYANYYASTLERKNLQRSVAKAFNAKAFAVFRKPKYN